MQRLLLGAAASVLPLGLSVGTGISHIRIVLFAAATPNCDDPLEV